MVMYDWVFPNLRHLECDTEKALTKQGRGVSWLELVSSVQWSVFTEVGPDPIRAGGPSVGVSQSIRPDDKIKHGDTDNTLDKKKQKQHSLVYWSIWETFS